MTTAPTDPERRRLLATTGGLIAAGLAGCPAMDTPTDDGGPSPTDGAAPTGTGRPALTGDENATGAPSTATPELDLREANVVGVEVTPEGDARRFDVTLHHDAAEDGYANWWRVETPDGERLGRRELVHPHGTRPFARSVTVAIPDGVPCVVVRGHDQVHGYGG